MRLKQPVNGLTAAGLAAALAAIAASPVLAQVGGANDRMPGGVERAPDTAGSGAASDSLKPSAAPRMGTTRGLTAKPPSAAAPAPAAAPPPAPAPAAPAAGAATK
jgi:hypothetical protein